MALLASSIEYIFNHVVLPPKLPQEDDYEAIHEQALIELVIATLGDLHEILHNEQRATVQLAIQTIENIHDSRDSRGDVSEASLENFLSRISCDKFEAMLPLEIKAQNAGVLISRRDDQVIFEVFELSPSNKAAMQLGRLVRCFPAYSSQISVNKLEYLGLRKSIAKTIAKMTTQSAPGFRPEVSKNQTMEIEARDTTHPGLITEFTMSIISALGQTLDVQRITKNTREDVLWSSCLYPWRRSPLWLLLRVTLQLFFTRNKTDAVEDSDLYKSFMVLMLARLLKLAKGSLESLGSEAIYLTSAKLTRRLLKLKLSTQSSSHLTALMDTIKKTMVDAHSLIQENWVSISTCSEADINTTTVKSLRPVDNIHMDLPSLDNLLSEIASRNREAMCSQFEPANYYPHHEPSELPNVSFYTNEYKIFHLAAFETWVENHLNNLTPQHLQDTETCGKLRRLMTSYHESARVEYAGIPVSMSNMILILVELWVVCDKSACLIHPLLREYDPEVDLFELQCLMLPLKSQMQRLHHVEQYVSSRQKKAKKYLPSLYREFGDSSSFAVRYFDSDYQLQTTLNQIEREAAVMQQRKKKELADLKAQYKQLMDAYETGTCQFETYIYNRHFGYTTTRHKHNCSRCTRKSEAESLGIHIYEWPISRKPSVAKSTVFELQIPKAFRNWRDCSAFLITSVLGFKNANDSRSGDVYQLGSHNETFDRRSFEYSQSRITPMSKTKPHIQTHRKMKKPVNLLTNADVCLDNALSLQYYDRTQDNWTSPAPKRTEAILKNCKYELPERSKALERFSHKTASLADGSEPNEILANLEDCPLHFSIDEYKALAALPFGGHLIYSNILTQLALPSVDFMKAETQCVILQTIQQAGGENGDVERTNHETLTEDSFGLPMIRHLDAALQRVEKNWESWRAVAIFSALTKRVLSLNSSPDSRSEALDLLTRLRKVCMEWISQLKNRATCSTNETQRTELFSLATEISLVCISTFDIDHRDFDTVLLQDSAISMLISCSITVQENQRTVQPENQSLYKSSLQAWRALMYRILPALCAKILHGSSGLDEAIKESWAAYHPNLSSHWIPLEHLQRHWLYTTSGNLPVHYNLLTAELLINGIPVANLPENFTCHTMYKILFDRSKLTVVPTDKPGLTFGTKTPYDGFDLHFGMKNNDMLVVALKGTSRWDLLPSHIFRGQLPYKFINDYVHWYDHTNHLVQFRPRDTPWSIEDEKIWYMKKDTASRKWSLIKGGWNLIDTRSEYARLISTMLRSLEDIGHIHVLLNTVSQEIDIELPRLQLGFFFGHQDIKIYSRQYRGMEIDPHQNIECLTGLVSKLVLRNRSDRMIIIPAPTTFDSHSIQFEKSSISTHTRVSISRHAATKVYSYMIDKSLGRIVDSGDLESKLYLSLLHALTSHCLPDGLTSLTGVESSLLILRSAAVRSFDLLTANQITLLSRIGCLSTTRSFYPAHLQDMQTVVWNENLPSLSQHPLFRTSVNSIFDQAMRLEFFHPESDTYGMIQKARQSFKSQNTLSRREAVRTAMFRVSGFGAEEYTTLDDVKYAARDQNLSTLRTSRVHKTVIMMQRDQVALQERIPNLHSSLLSAHFSRKRISGAKELYDMEHLQYDSKWLEDPSPLLIEHWCNLHRHLSDTLRNSNKYNIMFWLATMSYAEAADMNAIQALFGFYRIEDLANIRPPSANEFHLNYGNEWQDSEISEIARSAAKSYYSSTEANMPRQEYESESQHDRRILRIFEERQNQAFREFTRALKEQWPIQRPFCPTSTTISLYVNVESAMESVTLKVERWYNNRLFHNYLQQVSNTMALQAWVGISSPCYALSLPQETSGLGDDVRYFSPADIFRDRRDIGFPCTPHCEPEILNEDCTMAERNSSTKDNLEDLCKELQSYAKSKCGKSYVDELRNSCAALDQRSGNNQVRDSLVDGFQDLLQSFLDDCKSYLNKLGKVLLQYATDCDVLPDTIHTIRISPQFWLEQLHISRFSTLSDSWKSAIITYGLAMTKYQRAQRLLALVEKPVDLIEELRHVGHTNWDPREHPETLLLEAENSILVRQEQEFIASKMRSDTGDNIVLQLLMGGGKSTTIVPILSAFFSDKKRLVRVIVAKPQSKQMLQMLISKLGGLLKRRIYHMPFSRNIKMTLENAIAIRDLYTECVANRGVLMVLPEQILSFRLMAIECVLTEKPEIAQSLLATQTFFDEKSRDIVDECDENFNVKFELIYTMGTQQAIEFSPNRWIIIQHIIGLIPEFAKKVQETLPEAVEIYSSGKGKFPRIRLLRKDAVEKLLEVLATHIVEHGIPSLPTRSQSLEMQTAIHKYITRTELSRSEIEDVERSRFWTESTKSPLLLVRGLIAGGVLHFVFTNKRWRVNYGHDLTRIPPTRLAVPYRSKDTPSPRSEFSHPDVVILLTLLSYYYRGLSDDELFDTLTHVLKSDQAIIHYDEFVSTTSNLPSAFRQLSGLSIRDRHQCITEVFPALRYSKKAIDYFLSYLVFPKQLKQFPSKLSNSGWDLGARKTHPLSGFSGTNDTLHLLPLEVKHLDLPSQSHTNAQVLGYLLQKENSVELLSPRSGKDTSDGKHLLKFLQSLPLEIRVVLDCGASILEQSNKEVAQAWLSMRDNDIEAVVYFEEEELSVLDRTGGINSFQTSPFAKNLEVCIVYLDESHTRGTDLKLPRDYRAAVTLGSQLTKDRLTQACMRMRKLGYGQSVTFIVPEEIVTKIRELTHKSSSDTILVQDVLCWSIKETWQDLKRSMPLWAVQGQRYERQRGLLNGANTTKEQAEGFLEAEAQDLEVRYKPKPRDDNTSPHLADWDMSNPNLAKIISRCQDFEAMGFNSAALSEEQERELAPEIEEEKQIERPARMLAEKHRVHTDLEHLVQHGKLINGSQAYEPAFQSLRSTSAAKLFPLSDFPTDLLVTHDFMRTVKIPTGSTRAAFVSDSYQRPVHLVISVPNPSSRGTVQNLLIISPYEANKLLPKIRSTKAVTLHLFAARSNISFQPLDRLELYNVGHIFAPSSVFRSLTLQLNLFAGSLYFRSLDEYGELCDYLGLLRTKVRAGQQVWADGFIDPPTGMWGLEASPVPFLKALLMKIRREGEGVEKTHLGKLLDGVQLDGADFNNDCVGE